MMKEFAKKMKQFGWVENYSKDELKEELKNA
jgi:hypothetical protein